MLVDRKDLGIAKGIKIQFGYQNACAYDFTAHRVFLLNKNDAKAICQGEFSSLPSSYIDSLRNNLILSDGIGPFEMNPEQFDYSLFHDRDTGKRVKIIYLEVTERCNYRCLHCYAETDDKKNQDIALETIEKVINDLGSCPEVDFRITGGEPFLHPQIFAILELISHKVKPLSKHTIVTNGSFSLEDAIRAINLGFDLQISIYGMQASTFVDFTKTTYGQFQIVQTNLSRLSDAQYRDHILLLFSTNALTYFELNGFEKWAQAAGLRYIVNRPASVGRAVDNWDTLKLTPQQYVEFSKKQVTGLPQFCYHLCQLHWTVISVNGDVSPCSFIRLDKHPEFLLGNVLSDCFPNVWAGEKYEAFRSLNASDAKDCSACEFKYLCTAGCCGESLCYCGDLFARYPWCAVRPAENPDYFLVLPGKLFEVEKIAAGVFDFHPIDDK